MVSPYVAIAAIRTVPCSSEISSTSRTTRRAGGARLGDAPVDVGHLEGDVDDAVAVPAVVLDQRAVGVDRAVDDEADRAGAQHEGLVVAVAVLGTGVGLELHAPRGLVVVRGLGGVADHEHDRVPPGDREDVAVLVVLHEADELPQLLEGEVGLELVGGERGAGGRLVGRRSHGHRVSGADRVCNSTPKRWTTCTGRSRHDGRPGPQIDRAVRRRAAHRRPRGVAAAGRRPGHRPGPPRQARRERRGHRLGTRPLAGGAGLPGDGVPDPRDPPGRRATTPSRPTSRASPRSSRPTRSPAPATCGRGWWPAPTPTSSG